MSEIEMKVKEHTKEMAEICEKLTKSLARHIDGGIENADTQEVALVADSIKDMCIAKEKCIKGMYYEQIMEAMKDSEYGEEYDEEGPKSYRGRSARTGRYVHRGYEVPQMPEMKMAMRDMDKSEGKMYYSEDALTPIRHYGNNNMGYEEGHRMGYEEGHRNGYREGHNRGYEEGRNRGYEEGRANSSGAMSSSRYDSARRGFEEGQDKEQKTKALTEYLRTIADDITNMVMEMDPQEKQVVKNKLQAIQNKIA